LSGVEIADGPVPPEEVPLSKLMALVAAGALAFVPAGALAKPKPKKPSPRAHTYKAVLKAVGADAAYTTKRFGRAQLVDGKKNNKVTIHVRGLTPGGKYLWHVHQAKKAGDPCTEAGVGNPAPYPGWDWTKVNPFTANASGNYNKTFKTKTFPISTAAGDTGFVYYVNVHLNDAAATVIACGKFKGSRKATPKWKKAHRKGPRAHRH
jgi:hypothetical protein